MNLTKNFSEKNDIQALYQAMTITNKSVGQTIMQALTDFNAANNRATNSMINLSTGSFLEINWYDMPNTETELKKYLGQEFIDSKSQQEYDLILDQFAAIARQYSDNEIIAFHGTKLLEYQHTNEMAGDFSCYYEEKHPSESEEKILLRQNAAVRGIPTMALDENFFNLINTGSKQDFNPISREDIWIIPDEVSYEIFLTSTNKFLIFITPNTTTMADCRLEISHLMSTISDYAVLTSIDHDLNMVKGEKTGCEFMLPTSLVLKALDAITSKPRTKFLKI